MKIISTVCLVLISSVLNTFSAVSVNWSGPAGPSNVYDSNGNVIGGNNLLIQLIIDVNGDTDFSQFESTQMLGIDSETSFGGVMSTAIDDRVGAWETGLWFDLEIYGQPFGSYMLGDSGGIGPVTTGVDDLYASSQFYFRWFNAETIGAATEVGYIWDTTWVTPSDPANPAFNASLDYAAVTGSGTGGGTESGGGWATVQPVPEPGTMALFALGLATLGASRRRRKVQA